MMSVRDGRAAVGEGIDGRWKEGDVDAWPGDGAGWETRAWGAPSGSVDNPEEYDDGAQPNCQAMR